MAFTPKTEAEIKKWVSAQMVQGVMPTYLRDVPESYYALKSNGLLYADFVAAKRNLRIGYAANREDMIQEAKGDIQKISRQAVSIQSHFCPVTHPEIIAPIIADVIIKSVDPNPRGQIHL